MTRVLISHDSLDAAFIDRLTNALTQHDIEVTRYAWNANGGWLRARPTIPIAKEFEFCCVVISERTTGPARAEFARLLKLENTGDSGVLLAIRAGAMTLPEEMERRKYADFSESYDAGVRQLLFTFGRVVTNRLFEQQRLTVISARRGIANRVGSLPGDEGVRHAAAMASHRMTTTVFLTEQSGEGIVALFEGVGHASGTSQLPTFVDAMVRLQLQEGTISATAQSFHDLFMNVNNVIKHENEERKLTRNNRIGGKMSVVVLIGDYVYFAAIGATGLLVRTKAEDKGWNFARQEPRSELRLSNAVALGRDDENAVWACAPLGYFDEGDISVDPIQIPLRNPGEYVAMTSFPLPYVNARNQSTYVRISRQTAAANVARELVRSHVPLFDDCLACVVQRLDQS